MMLEKRSNRKGSKTKGMAGLNVIEKQCVWMKAGVINFRICENDYDCLHCSFDRSMRAAMDAQAPTTGVGRPAGWAEKMRKDHTGREKPCVYYLIGRIGPPGNCPRDYQCDDCPVELELGYRPMQRSVEAARYAGEMERFDRASGFQVVENECVWMKAGIVSFRLCDNDYDCYNCDFDLSMRQAMEEKSAAGPEALESAAEAHEIGIAAVPCIYHLIGENDAPVECDRSYECFRCPVHRSLSKGVDIKPAPMAQPHCSTVAGYKIAEDYYYHFGHSWVHIVHGECVRVGVDGFVGKVFGAADILDIPQPGTALKQAHLGCMLTRDGRQAPVLSPLSGKILAVNQKVVRDPEIVCEDPYHEGWLFQMEPSFLKLETQGLYADQNSFRWMERENQQLLKLLGPSYERLAATGGEVVSDLIGHFPEIGWDALVRTFLRTRGR
jgi:glycine cleavage system H lipoate-binding protein